MPRATTGWPAPDRAGRCQGARAAHPISPTLASVPFSSPLAAELAEGVLERFLRYVRVDTQAEEGAPASTFPSTAKQLDLSRILAEELREIGLDDV